MSDEIWIKNGNARNKKVQDSPPESRLAIKERSNKKDLSVDACDVPPDRIQFPV